MMIINDDKIIWIPVVEIFRQTRWGAPVTNTIIVKHDEGNTIIVSNEAHKVRKVWDKRCYDSSEGNKCCPDQHAVKQAV